MAGHPRGDEGHQQRGRQRHEPGGQRCAARHQEFHLLRVQQTLVQRPLVLGEQEPLLVAQRRAPYRVRGARPRAGNALHRRRRAEQGEGADDGELPRRREHDGRDDGEGEQDDEETGAKADLLH